MSKSDDDIKSAQRKNTSTILSLSAMLGLLVLAYILWLLLAKGFVINVLPEQAEKTKTIAVSNGLGLVLGDSVYSFGGNLTIAVSAAKFITKQLQISADSPPVIEVVLEPSPGELIITTSASGDETNWYIDGKLVHIGATLSESLKPGNYQIKVDDKFHQAAEIDVSINSLEKTEKIIALIPIQGSISIASKPVGAEVIINGEVAGVTPLELNKTGGYFDIEINANGYELLTDKIEISNQELAISRNYILEPKKALIKISATPADGTLLINGKVSQQGDNLVAANKVHTLLFEKEGYFSFNQSFNLQPAEIESIDIQLKPEFGKLTITAEPNATIKINGIEVATGSFSDNLPAIEHKIEISKPGYRAVSQTIKPTSKRLSKIDVELLTEFAARRAEGKPLFADSIGINLSKFKMDAFTTGSPANEKWRRRNEFEIPVNFSKSVWVSRHEITEAQFKRFKSTVPSSSLPVTNVTWNEAALFCNWLSQQEGLPIFYKTRGNTVVGYDAQSKGYRLPTEAEWEWLAKKSKRASATVYPWGNLERIPKNTGNFADESVKGSQTFYLSDYNDGFKDKAPVGSFRADRAGLYDLAGNVSEWVNDFYTNVPPSTDKVTDYMGSSRGSAHIFKGGNYQSGRLSELRAAYRESSETASATIGFRIARYD